MWVTMEINRRMNELRRDLVVVDTRSFFSDWFIQTAETSIFCFFFFFFFLFLGFYESIANCASFTPSDPLALAAFSTGISSSGWSSLFLFLALLCVALL